MNKKFYGLLCLSMLILIFVALPTLANHAWGNYHWERAQNPAQLTIYNSLTSDWYGFFGVSVADWDASSVLSLSTVLSDNSQGTRKKCSADGGTIRVCNADYGNTGWLGIAGISVSGDHITAGYTKVNDTYFNTATYNTPEWRQMVICQELGHDFGLGHQDENFDDPPWGTCMDYTRDPVPNQHPDAHDYEQLEIIYSHLDSGGGGGGGGGCFPPNHPSCRNGLPGINGADYNSPASWGQLVRQNGRIAVYERDFGNGNKVVTVVIWAN